MEVTLHLPDGVGERLAATGGSLSRRALEALAADEYRKGNLTKPDLRQILGFETSDQIDTFLHAHEVWIEFTTGDLEAERDSLNRLGV